MHETVVANRIINDAKKHGNPSELFLEIGELAHVPADDLIPVLNNLTDWRIHHRIVPAICSCTCGYRGSPKILERGHDFFLVECPVCKAVPKVIQGTEITLHKVVLD